MPTIQVLPETARLATGDDFFDFVFDRTMIKSNVHYYEDTVSGYVERITSTDTNGEQLIWLIKKQLIYIINN